MTSIVQNINASCFFEGEGVNFSMVFIGGVTLVGVYHSAM